MAITPPPGYELDQPQGGPTPPPGYVLDKPAEDISMPESFGRGALNNFPLAQQATAALTPGNYSPNLANLNAKASAAKQANPISYGAGAVAGAAAPLAIPGVGEALESAPIAGNALLGAANAVGNTDITQHPKEALKQGLQGAVAGGAIGKVGELASDALKPVSEGMEKYANRKAVQEMGLPAGVLNIPKEDVEKLGSTIHNLKLDQGSLDDRFNLAQAHLQDVGSKIGTLGETASLPNPEKAVNTLNKHLQESSSIFGAEANPEATVYRQAIANLQQPGLSFNKLQDLKTAVGSRAFDNFGNAKNDAAANVYGVYKDAMKDIVKASPKEYQDLMDQYGDLKDFTNALGKARGNVNATGSQTKGFGMAGKLGSMVTGGNPAASATLGAGLMAGGHPFMGLGAMTPIVTNPGAMANLARSGATAIPKTSQALTQELNDYLTSKYGNAQ
jgi:hypothetical protein